MHLLKSFQDKNPPTKLKHHLCSIFSFPTHRHQKSVLSLKRALNNEHIPVVDRSTGSSSLANLIFTQMKMDNTIFSF